MDVRLRLAGDADRHALQQVDDLARGGDVDRNAFIDEAVSSRQCLLAEGREIVGYVVTAPRHFFDRDFVELLMVRDGYRRRGVGRAMLRAAVDRAGTSRVFSSTNESNAAMRSLFTAEGWTLSGRLDGLDEGDPEVVYFIDQHAQHADSAQRPGHDEELRAHWSVRRVGTSESGPRGETDQVGDET